MAQSPPAAFKSESFPPEVQKSLQNARSECRRAGGTGLTFAPDTVRKIDLTGDGRDDYIVTLRDTVCKEREHIYCGTGGCALAIFVARKGGGFRNVFSDQAHEYEILPGSGARTIRFSLHHGHCDGATGRTGCSKERKITDKSFSFR